MNDLDDLLVDTLARRADELDVHAPEFSELLGRHQRRTRRNMTFLSVGVIAIGLGGIMMLGRTTSTTSIPGPAAADEATTPSGPAPTSAPGDDGTAPFPPLDTIEPGTAPGWTEGTTNTTPPIVWQEPNAEPYTYVAEDGATLTEIAEEFCLPRRDIADFNGFPNDVDLVAGELVRIPPGGLRGCGLPPDLEWEIDDPYQPLPTTTVLLCDTRNCVAGEHTIRAGDYPLKIAEQYCVPLDELNSANAGNSDYISFFPGQTVFIPPATTDEQRTECSAARAGAQPPTTDGE